MRESENSVDVWRVADAALAVWLGSYAFVFLVSETLSVFGVFRPVWIRAVWLLAAIAAGIVVWRKRERLSGLIVGLWRARRWPGTFTGWCVFATAVLTLACAVLAPSSAQDALVYHLPRASHWLANGSTAFYETAIARQNYQAQGFSLCVAHLLAVCGGDRLVNLIQWGAWWLLSAAAGLSAAELGAGTQGRKIAALLTLTLPQAVAQSVQAVGDLFAAVPLLAFALYLLRLERSDGRRIWGWSLAAGVALGLACVARQTGLVYGAVLGVTLGAGGLVRRWRSDGERSMAVRMAALGLAAAIGVSCAVPQMARNGRAYGDLFSGEPRHALTTEGLTPKLFAVNIVKHVATHLSMPVQFLNAPIERAVRKICGTAVDDPRIHYDGWMSPIPFKLVSTFGKEVLFVTNPLHFILFVAVFAGWVMGVSREKGLLSRVGVPVACGALLYCALFKWQLWAVRLTIPLYAWMAAGVGVWLAERESRFRCGVIDMLVVFAVMQAAVRPVWFMPAFLFGEGGAESGITREMTVSDKVRRLAERGFRRSDVESMRKTVPETERCGYSLFYTSRQRQYFGNETYRKGAWRHAQLENALRCVARVRGESGVSKTVGLLISSDNCNIPPEVHKEPFSCEYPMWTWGGGEDGRGNWRLEHFGVSDPVMRAQEIFGAARGVILSDQTRESVVERLRAARNVSLVASNAVFNVYAVGMAR